MHHEARLLSMADGSPNRMHSLRHHAGWTCRPGRMAGNRLLEDAGLYHGELIGGAKFATPVGRPSAFGSLRFDGASQYVATSLSLASRSALTLGGWFKRNAAGALVYICSNGSGASDNFQIGFFSDGNVYAGQASAISAAHNTTNWVHCVVTLSGASYRLYFDGAQTASNSLGSTTPSTAGTLDIGRRANNAFYSTGNIDGVWFFDRAVSAVEVRNWYEATRRCDPSLGNWQEPLRMSVKAAGGIFQTIVGPRFSLAGPGGLAG